MLARFRRGRRKLRTCAREVHRLTDYGDVAEFGGRHGLRDTGVDNLGIAEGLVDCVDRTGGHALRVQSRDQGFGILLDRFGLDDGVELRAILAPATRIAGCP